MKFAQYLTVLERDCPTQWRGKFVKYKQLKKMLKKCRPADQPEAPLNKEEEDAFFEELLSELRSINRYFKVEADRTVSAYQRQIYGIYFLFFYIPLCTSGPRKYAALAERAYWCRKYARANAVALRKILKKHDKVCGNGRGREFLQQCWCSTSADGIGLFLHSPLLDELKAVQDVLQEKIAELETLAPHDDDDHHEVDQAAEMAAKAKKGVLVTNEDDQVAVLQPNDRQDNNFAISTAAAENSENAATTTNNDTDKLALPPAILTRVSPSAASQSSDGLRGAVNNAPSGHLAPSLSGSLGSVTSPSLRAQRNAALAAIQESPTCMLDSSDIEWGEERMSQQMSGKLRGNNNNNGGGPLNDQQQQQQQHTDHHEIATISTHDGIDPDAPLPKVYEETSNQVYDDDDNFDNNPKSTPRSPTPIKQQTPMSTPNAKKNNDTTTTADGYYDGGGSSGVGPVLGPFRDDELRCPICLDLMYKPVGLGCGHKFCRPCALVAAGFGSTIGAFHNIISYIPSRTQCPQCRQTNVYRSAVSLKEVGALIKNRYPELWAERRAEERRRRQEISISYNRNQRARINTLMGTTPFDLINSSPHLDE